MTQDDILNVTAGGKAWELYRRMEAIGAPQAPLYEGAARGFIRLRNQLHPSAPWPIMDAKQLKRPTVIVINDDPGPENQIQSLGPRGWACANEIGSWAEAVLIHGAAGTRDEYLAAVCHAMLALRVAIIETSSIHAMDWHKAIRCPHTLLVMPTEGLHPVHDQVLH